jgi:hypothetical protein
MMLSHWPKFVPFCLSCFLLFNLVLENSCSKLFSPPPPFLSPVLLERKDGASLDPFPCTFVMLIGHGKATCHLHRKLIKGFNQKIFMFDGRGVTSFFSVRFPEAPKTGVTTMLPFRLSLSYKILVSNASLIISWSVGFSRQFPRPLQCLQRMP